MFKPKEQVSRQRGQANQKAKAAPSLEHTAPPSRVDPQIVVHSTDREGGSWTFLGHGKLATKNPSHCLNFMEGTMTRGALREVDLGIVAWGTK